MRFIFRLLPDRAECQSATGGRVLRSKLTLGTLSGPEGLETRQMLAFAPFMGRDTNDPQMVPQLKAGDPPNPQWNMEKIKAADTWTVYGGNSNSVVFVEDYGVDFRHEDFAASAIKQGQFWDYGKIFSSVSSNLRFARKGRDDFHFPVDIKKQDMPANWNETTAPDAGQYFGNIGAGIIGAKTNNNLGVAGVNWNVQVYSSKVIVNDTTNHDWISKRANRMAQYLRLGKIAGLQDNPNPQLIRAVSFGYSSATDYGDIFHTFSPVPETAPDLAGEYDFVALGRGIQGLVGDNGEQGILVTVPTGDWNKTWPTKYYDEGSWGYWKPWDVWNPNYPRGSGYSPGTPDNILAVAATDIDDKPWEGNADNPIDIYAPGEDIWSPGEQPATYVRESGTRQAQAHVAGAIALLYDAAAQHGYTPTYHEVREAIIEGGDDIGLGRPRLNIVNSIKYLSLLLGDDLTRRPEPLKTTVTITGGAADEGDVGTTAATFKLNLTRAIPAPITLGIQIEDGSAKAADGDFVSPNQSGIVQVTIPAQVKFWQFTIPVNGDRRIESSEAFTARIVSAPGNVRSGLGLAATWTIKNDDVPPTVSLASARAIEGAASRAGMARVVATLSKPSIVPVTVQYSVVSGTARVGVDYVPTSSNVITFPANTTSIPIDIGMIGDAVPEPDKSFQVRIDSVINGMASPMNGVAAVTIVDDDRILMSIRPAGQVAVAGGTVTMLFTVTLNRAPTPAEAGVQVSYRTVDGTGASAALAGIDFQTASGVLSFGQGETSKTISVTLLPRRTGQRYPKNYSMELSGLSGTGWFANGSAAVSAQGRIS